jgi:hypothetical protein
MKRADLCAWLRANSSGIYRPAAEAASEIERLDQAAKRLLSALDRLDEGCREPGFQGCENGSGEMVGDEAEDARQALRDLVQ